MHNTSLVSNEPDATLPQDKQVLDCASLCLLDTDGRVLARPAASVAELRRAHAAATRARELRRCSELTAPARKELFLLELRLGQLSEAEIAMHADGIELDTAERDAVARRRTDLAVRSLLLRVQELGAESVAESIYQMAKQGRSPGDETHDSFWLQALTYSARRGDAATAERAAAALLSQSNRRSPPTAEQRARWRALLEAARRQASAKSAD